MHHHISLLPIRLLALLITFSYHATAAIISTVTITVSSPAIPTSISYTNDAAFKSAMLAAHNFYRREHNVSDLAWNDTSAAYASKWAGNCVFKHSAGPTGENLAAGYTNASAAVEAWGLEGSKYDYERPGFSEATGHFTQLVWSNTTTVGCGRMACNGVKNTPGFYVVCEYYPPGNVVGDHNRYFVDNVKPMVKGKSSDTLESGMRNLGFRRKGEGGVIVLVVVAGVVLFVV